MSQIDNSGGYDFSHYENDAALLKETEPPLAQQLEAEQKVSQMPKTRRTHAAEHIPPELRRARPAPERASGMSGGRVAACIVTAGISELLRLAWLGIKACCTSSAPAPARQPRTGASSGKPLPDAGKQKDLIDPALRNSILPNMEGLGGGEQKAPVGQEPRKSVSAGKAQPAPEPRADVQNAPLTQALRGKGEFPPAHQAAIDEITDELRGQYGSKYIPEGINLRDLLKIIPNTVYPYTARDVFMGIKEAEHAVSPQDLQGLIRQHFVPHLKKMALADMAAAAAQEQGGLGGLNIVDFTMNQLRAPGMQQRLDACTSMEDVRALFQDMGLGKTIAETRAGLLSVVSELQGIYGKDALPADLEGVLKMGNKEDAEDLRLKLESQYHTSKEAIGAGEVKDFASEYLLPAAQHDFVSRALARAAREQGVPLTDRSVSALASAILAGKGNKAAISAAKDPRDLAQIVNGFVKGILPAQKAAVEQVYAQYAEQVQPEQRPLLRIYIEGLSFAPADAKTSRQEVEAIAGYMKNWKNFTGNEKEMQALNRIYQQAYADDLRNLKDASSASSKFKDDIYETLRADANRSDYTVNGVPIPQDKNASTELIRQLKSQLPDPQDQRFISKLINQRLQGNWVIMTSAGMLPNGQMAQDVPGTRSIPVMAGGKSDFQHDMGVGATYDVTVAPDKKTAVVTATMTQGLHYLDNTSYNGRVPSYGAVKYTYNFTLNLSAHPDGQGVAGFSVGQQFMTLDEARAQGGE